MGYLRFQIFRLASTVTRTASASRGILPRPKNMPPACFCPGYRRGRAFESLSIPEKKRTPKGCPLFFWQNYHKLIQCTALWEDAPPVLHSNSGTIGTERTDYYELNIHYRFLTIRNLIFICHIVLSTLLNLFYTFLGLFAR